MRTNWLYISCRNYNFLDRGEKTYFIGGKKFNILFEFFIGYIYYILFFRSGGRTPGKRLLRLRVIDLKGRQRLGWYQSLERTHGYAASTLLVFLGFLQVLWDREGLAMHDKLAGTTVILLKKNKALNKTSGHRLQFF